VYLNSTCNKNSPEIAETSACDQRWQKS